MQYRITCKCGNALTIAEGAAGTRIPCPCGCTIIIPSLRELRQQSGLPEVGPSPEMAVEAMLLAGTLPEEDYCVVCGAATDHSVCCRTECEKARVLDSRPPWWIRAPLILLAFCTFGLFGATVGAATPGQEREWGKDRIFDLPVRVCDACRQELTNEEAVK